MESASAVPSPRRPRRCRSPRCTPCRPPTAPRSASRATRWARKGPLVLAPGYGNAARAFALDTVPKSFVAVPRRARLRRLAARLPREPGPAVELHASSPSTTSRCATGRRPSTPSAARPARTRSRRMGHCVGGLSLFMAIGGGLEGLRSATFSALAGHPIPTPGNRLRAGVRLATMFKRARHQGPEHRLRPRVTCPTARSSASCASLPFRHVYDSPVARRIYFIYGDVFDYENIDEATMEEAVPELLRQRQHDVLRAHLADDPARARRRNARARTRYVSNLDAYRMPINFITGEHNRMFVPRGPAAHATSTLRAAQRPRAYAHHVFEDYAHLDLLAGRRTPSATCSRPPSPSWSATTHEHHR